MEMSFTTSFSKEESSLTAIAAGIKRGVQMAGYEEEQQEDEIAAAAAADNNDETKFPGTPHPFSKKMRVTDDETAIMTPTLGNAISYEDADIGVSSKSNHHVSPDAIKTNDNTVNTPDAPPDLQKDNVENGAGDAGPEEDEEDEEPDWDKLGANDPNAQAQIDMFLKAREMRDQADDHFSHTMDDCHNRLEATKKQILQAVANVHNLHRTELDYLEADIKSTLIWNHKARTEMTAQLEETRNRAQGLFQQLLMNVSAQPLFGGGGGAAANSIK